MKLFQTLCLSASILMLPAAAQSVDNAIQMLRGDIRADKTAILTKAMNLSEADGAKFWPLQREYQNALESIGDKRIALIKDYASKWETLTPEQAKTIGDSTFKLEQERLDLRKNYFKKASKAVNPNAAARWMQIENQIQQLIDIQTSSLIPLVK